MARTLRIRSITPGKMVGGRFIPNARKKVNASRLGSGKRFEKCVAEVTARGGAQDPNAVCGAAGMRKYGKERMEKWAQKGRHKNPTNFPRLIKAQRRKIQKLQRRYSKEVQAYWRADRAGHRARAAQLSHKMTDTNNEIRKADIWLNSLIYQSGRVAKPNRRSK